MTTLLFSISAMQYWLTNYMVKIIGYTEKAANISYVWILVTSPVAGGIISGKISSSFGGHKSPKTLPFTITVGGVSMVLMLLFPALNEKLHIEILMWVAFFCGGLLVPMVIGSMMGSVEPEDRP